MSSVYSIDTGKKKKGKFLKEVLRENEVYLVDDTSDFSFEIKKYDFVEKNCLDGVIDSELTEMKSQHPEKLVIAEILDREKNLVLYSWADQKEIDHKINEVIEEKVYIDRYIPESYLVAKYTAHAFAEKPSLVYLDIAKYRYGVLCYQGQPYYIEKEKIAQFKDLHDFDLNYEKKGAIQSEEKIELLKKNDLFRPIIEDPEFIVVIVCDIYTLGDEKIKEGLGQLYYKWVIRSEYNTMG